MNDYLVLYTCINCGEEHYFPPDSLPGDDEFCEYCDLCGGKLIKANTIDGNTTSTTA